MLKDKIEGALANLEWVDDTQNLKAKPHVSIPNEGKCTKCISIGFDGRMGRF